MKFGRRAKAADAPITAKNSIADWLAHPAGGPAFRALLAEGGQTEESLKPVRMLALQRLVPLSKGMLSQERIDALVLAANGGRAPLEQASAPTEPEPLPVPSSVSAEAQEWLQLPFVQLEYPAIDDIEAWAAHVDEIDAYIRDRFSQFQGGDAAVVEREVNGVRTYVLNEEPDGPITLHIHGGALMYGGGDLVASMAQGNAAAYGMTTWAIDYRMPPRHPYPAGLDDCVAVYRALLEIREPHEIFVAGGSAGGNLAAALIHRLKDEGLAVPAALVLQTPEIDLTESGDAFAANRGADNILGSLMTVNRLYAGDHDLAHPHLSPLFGDLTGFPPTFLQSGTRDMYLSNTVRMHRKLREAGVDAELHVWEAMPHGGFGGASPEDRELNDEVRRFIDKHRSAA